MNRKLLLIITPLAVIIVAAAIYFLPLSGKNTLPLPDGEVAIRHYIGVGVEHDYLLKDESALAELAAEMSGLRLRRVLFKPAYFDIITGQTYLLTLDGNRQLRLEVSGNARYVIANGRTLRLLDGFDLNPYLLKSEGYVPSIAAAEHEIIDEAAFDCFTGAYGATMLEEQHLYWDGTTLQIDFFFPKEAGIEQFNTVRGYAGYRLYGGAWDMLGYLPYSEWMYENFVRPQITPRVVCNIYSEGAFMLQDVYE